MWKDKDPVRVPVGNYSLLANLAFYGYDDGYNDGYKAENKYKDGYDESGYDSNDRLWRWMEDRI